MNSIICLADGHCIYIKQSDTAKCSEDRKNRKKKYIKTYLKKQKKKKKKKKKKTNTKKIRILSVAVKAGSLRVKGTGYTFK